MSEEILMNVTPMESRVALVENGILQEVVVERERSRGIVGNIYCGKVVRVLPGMQAAFVDIGLDKASFIHVGDLVARDDSDEEPDIRLLLREGQSLLVQVVKDPLGSKGARLTGHLSVSSRYLVYMPKNNYIGISNRIEDSARQDLLKSGLADALAEVMTEPEDKAMQAGYIIRTAAEFSDYHDFVADVRYLKRLWRALQKKIDAQTAPTLIYEDLNVCERTMRDFVYPELEKIRVDSRPVYERLVKFAKEFIPEFVDKIEVYESSRPIFDLFSVEDEITKALGRRVQLKSGGSLVIDQTEAMTTIDVNTGTFVGKRNLEETIFKTNLEAATALARQLRLRNLGGIIIIDFIDMKSEEHQRQTLRTLEKAVEKDKTTSHVGGFSDLGLVQMTRKRTRESLEHVLSESCHVCDGRGSLKSAETVCSEIFREILREARAYENSRLLVLASQSVVDRLIDEDAGIVADLQELLDKQIEFQVEPVYTQEQFDVVLS
ncbi:ribonuclease G [Pseudomonadales bacterium]|nr:ribonuclease G [Pseudomonadales bacterium]